LAVVDIEHRDIDALRLFDQRDDVRDGSDTEAVVVAEPFGLCGGLTDHSITHRYCARALRRPNWIDDQVSRLSTSPSAQ
jgi:hypothetical protein